MRLLVLLALLTACAGKATQKTPDKTSACPATFAQGTGRCIAPTTAAACSYPEGTCVCSEKPRCGGIPPPENEPPPPTVWQCKQTPPPQTGGPAMPPSGACSDAGKECTYSVSECASPDVFTCNEGRWSQTQHGSKPG